MPPELKSSSACSFRQLYRDSHSYSKICQFSRYADSASIQAKHLAGKAIHILAAAKIPHPKAGGVRMLLPTSHS